MVNANFCLYIYIYIHTWKLHFYLWVFTLISFELISITPVKGPLQGDATRLGTQLQTFTLIKIDLSTCNFFVPLNLLLHSQYVRLARHKGRDTISIHRGLRPNSYILVCICKYVQLLIPIFTHIYIYIYIPIFTNPSVQAGYDTRSIFKRSLTGLNSEFSFS